MTAEFELLDHPADIGFRAHGKTLEELFGNCGLALVSIILDPSNITAAERYSLEAEGTDRESLLVNWLNEVLFYVDTRRLAFDSFAVSFVTPHHVRCIASGEPRDPEKHPVRLFVKAVTYHQLRLSKNEQQDAWTAEVYVDV